MTHQDPCMYGSLLNALLCILSVLLNGALKSMGCHIMFATFTHCVMFRAKSYIPTSSITAHFFMLKTFKMLSSTLLYLFSVIVLLACQNFWLLTVTYHPWINLVPYLNPSLAPQPQVLLSTSVIKLFRVTLRMTIYSNYATMPKIFDLT